MLRRISNRMSSSRKEREMEATRRRHEYEKSNKVLADLATSMVNYNAVPDLVPNSRNGISLFQPKESAVGESVNDMDRTLYEMPQPENVDAMTDLIKMHKSGDKFPYVGIVGSEGETLDARRSKMLSLKPSLGLRNLPEIEVSACPLINTEGEFSMSNLMKYASTPQAPDAQQEGPMPTFPQKKKFSISKPYVHIKSIMGLYTPNMSSTSDFCRLWFVLIDNRLVNQNKAGQSSAVVSNQESVMEMSCDYCVSYNDLEHFVLGYTLERDIMKPGFQWGTVTFYFNLTESDMPYQSAKKDTLGVYRMPITTLTERQTNADKSDISFTADDVKAMRQMYQRGDVVDVDEPQRARMKKSSYSKSTMRGATKGEEMAYVASGFEQMDGFRKPMLPATIASVSIEDGSDYDEPVEPPMNRREYEAKQELLREEQEKIKAEHFRKVKEMERGEGKELVGSRSSTDGSEPEIMKKMESKKPTKKGVDFQVQDV